MGGVKVLLQLANFTLGPDATLNTEIHKILVRIKAPNSVNASKRKHKNQINHYFVSFKSVWDCQETTQSGTHKTVFRHMNKSNYTFKF